MLRRLSFRRRPAVSIVVVLFNMAREAPRTLYSLSSSYQREVNGSEYEVVVVDNGSSAPVSEETVKSFGENFRYYSYGPSSPSPVAAINFGAAQAKAEFIGLMIDGARLVTPGILRHAMMGLRMAPNPVVSTVSWHLGPDVQYRSTGNGFSREREDDLLAGIDWRANGYRLFDVSSLAGSSREGFFRPLAESNCFFMPRKTFERLGGFEERFDLPGGGLANLDMYKRACEVADAKLFILLGEGSFHQVHGGISTNATEEENNRLWHLFEKEYIDIRGKHYQRPDKRPEYIGHVPPELLRFVRYSAEKAESMHS
jgi:glycosyltransferase involved in cell wall biosynthesis